MAITRLSLKEIRARPSRFDRKKVESATEEDIRRWTVEDGHDPDADIPETEIFSPGYVRRRLGMTQVQFAKALCLPVATLRNWEQNRVTMDPAAISLLRIVAREPEIAFRALRSGAA